MRKFECPTCHDKVEALASTVWHRCPAWRNRPQWYKDVTDEHGT